MLRRMATLTTTIARQLKLVQEQVEAAASRRPAGSSTELPRLVAVSKTKGIDMIIEAYDAGQRHFGENYVVELHEKANDIELQDRCDEIRWHFIGHLQRNKVTKLLDSPNLFVIETVDSEKLAKAINDAWLRLKKAEPIKVMAQVNCSGEENKSGCQPSEALKLVKYIHTECPRLNLVGLMTIGAYDHDPSKGINPDFVSLVKVREEVCKELNIPVNDLELSMGMSGDFVHAIELGSTNVRVGSTIFGSRNTSKPAGGPVQGTEQKDESADSTVNIVDADLKPEEIQNLVLS